jgi:hypothetical protein
MTCSPQRSGFGARFLDFDMLPTDRLAARPSPGCSRLPFRPGRRGYGIEDERGPSFRG